MTPVYNTPQPGVDKLVDELDAKGTESNDFSGFVVNNMTRTVNGAGELLVTVHYRMSPAELTAAQLESPLAVERLLEPDPAPMPRPSRP